MMTDLAKLQWHIHHPLGWSGSFVSQAMHERTKQHTASYLANTQSIDQPTNTASSIKPHNVHVYIMQHTIPHVCNKRVSHSSTHSVCTFNTSSNMPGCSACTLANISSFVTATTFVDFKASSASAKLMKSFFVVPRISSRRYCRYSSVMPSKYLWAGESNSMLKIAGKNVFKTNYTIKCRVFYTYWWWL